MLRCIFLWSGSRVRTKPLTLEFGLPFSNEPRGRGLDVVLQPLEERLLVQPRRNRLEKLDDDRAWQTNERTAAPEQTRIERHRHARHADHVVKMRNAELIFRLGAGRPACSF